MAIKLNGVEITSNKLNGSNVSEEKLNGTKVWPVAVYVAAIQGTLIADVGTDDYYTYHVATFRNPNPFPVKIDTIQYKKGGVVNATYSDHVPANTYSFEIYNFLCEPGYAFKVEVTQSYSDQAQPHEGYNEIFTMSVQSSNYSEEETTTTTR